MAQSKVHSCSSMVCSGKRALFLHHSLHSCFLQVTTDGLGWDGLVLDILKGSGELDSILSLSSSNQPDGMTHVSGSNDGRVTTRGFGKIRTEFGVDSTDIRVVYTSSKRDLVSRLTPKSKQEMIWWWKWSKWQCLYVVTSCWTIYASHDPLLT